MFWFIVSCLFIFLAIAAFPLSFKLKRINDPDRDGMMPRGVLQAISGVLAALAVIIFFADTLTVVGTKNVGVVTKFGKPTGYLTNGLHFVAPWAKVTEISDAVQTDTYASDNGDDNRKQGGATDTCIHVRIEQQATACVNVSIRWQIIPSGVDYLFRNFKSNQHITDNLVLRDLQQAVNAAFVNYDPLGIDGKGNNTNLPLTDYANRVTTQLRTAIGKWIDVQSVIIPILNYDDATQKKVSGFLQQIAATRIANQQILTNQAQAKANKALAESVSNDPNVLVSKCLDILKELVDKGQSLPAGFSCFGPSANPVAVPAK